MDAQARDWLSSLAGTLEEARVTLAQPLRAAAALGEGTAGRALAAGWIALSLALLCLAAVTLLLARRARRSWPVREIAGISVQVAPTTGPAVLGLRRPEVVVPEWLLHAPQEEQRLVVLHEREHIRAHDPLLLAAGCLSVVLIPWNPLAWWMLLRLRLAVELDCDVRVLRGGVRPQTYGSLLIDMAGHGPGLSLGVPALAGSPSTLERRLRAMTTRLPRFAALRASALGTLGLAALVAACETRMPTAPEIEEMDVAAAETQAKRLQIVTAKDGEVNYFINGKQVSAEEARALAGDRIARVEILRGQAGKETRIHINTDTVSISHDLPRGQGKGESTRVRVMTSKLEDSHFVPARNFEGLLLVDGAIVDPSRMRTLNPDQIEKIEVIKGAPAAKLHSDPKAANGVIRITTKAGASKR